MYLAVRPFMTNNLLLFTWFSLNIWYEESYLGCVSPPSWVKIAAKKPCFRRQNAGLWPLGGIRNIPSASAAYRWTFSAEDSHLFSTGSRFPDLWINAGPRLLANIAMTYAAGSPFTVTGSFGIPTRFPFTRQWRHCVGYSAVVVQRPLSYHVCRICQAQSSLRQCLPVSIRR